MNALILSSGVSQRKKTRMCCHDNWGIRWTMGCCQLQQQGEVYLQETSRGCTCDNGAADHPTPQLCVWLDPFDQQELLLQSRGRSQTHENEYNFKHTKVIFKYFSLPLILKLYTKSEEKKKNWYEARDFCRAIGGDLLSIHSSRDLNRNA